MVWSMSSGTAYRSGVGEHVGGVAQQDLFAQLGRDFVAVEGDVSGGEVDHRFEADAAVFSEHGGELAQHHGTDVFGPADTGAGAERFGSHMHVDDGAGPGLLGVERRRDEVQRMVISPAGRCQRHR